MYELHIISGVSTSMVSLNYVKATTAVEFLRRHIRLNHVHSKSLDAFAHGEILELDHKL